MTMVKQSSAFTRWGKHLFISVFGLGYFTYVYSVRLLRWSGLAPSAEGEKPRARARYKSVPQNTNLLVLTVLVSAGLILAGCTRDPAVRRQKYFDSGMEYYKTGKLSEAAIQFRNALKVDAKFAEAGTMLAKAQMLRGDFADVYKLLLNAIQSKPDYLPAHLTMGVLYLLGNRLTDAREEADYVLERSPDDVEGLLLLANCQGAEKDLLAAEETIHRALKINPTHRELLFALASIKMGNRQLPAAEELLKQVIANEPNSPDGYIRLAGFYDITGRAPEAEPLLEKAVEVSKNDGVILETQTRYYMSQQNWTEAKKVVQKLQTIHGSEEKYWTALGDFYILRGEWDKARAELQRVRQERKNAAVVAHKLVEVLLALKDLKTAEEINESILKENQKDALAHLAKGRLLLVRGDFNNALLELNQTKEYRPDLPALHFWYAQVHSQKGDLEQAKQSLGEALKYDPNFWLARLSLAELQNRTGLPDAALVNVQDLLKRNPRDLQAYLLMSQAYLVKKDLPQAEKVLKMITEQAPQNPQGRWQLGVLRMLQGNFVDARQQLEQVWNVQPESEPTLQAMVMSYLMQKQPQQAIDFLQKQISGRPGQAFLYHTLGEILRQQNKREEAIANFNKALASSLDSVQSAVALADLYMEEGKTDQAIQLLLEATKRRPQDSGLALSAAMGLERAERWPEAQGSYQRVLELDSANPVALNNLAWMLAEHGGNIDVALKLAQQAKERQTDNVQVTNTIGWIYYKKSSYQMALQYLRDSAEKNQKNPLYQYQLGLVYWKLGRMTDARQALQSALKLNPKFSEAENARSVLARL